MADHKQCEKCGNPLRPHAKFCPKCGHPVEEKDSTSGILSFDDFFEDEKINADSVEEKVNIEENPIEHKDKIQEKAEEKKKVFTFKERDKKRKVRVLEDTLELPIEEIQREIEKRRNFDRMNDRSDLEIEKDRKKMEGLYDNLKKDDVLIPESEILDESDKPEKKGLFQQAKSYLMGTDNEDIEGVDVRAQEKEEERRAKKARRRQRHGSIEPEEEKVEPVIIEQQEEKSHEIPPAVEKTETADEPIVLDEQESDEPKKFTSGLKGIFGIQKEERQESEAKEVEEDKPVVIPGPKEKDICHTEKVTGIEEPKKQSWFQSIFGEEIQEADLLHEEQKQVVGISEEAQKEEKEKKPISKKFLAIAAALVLIAGTALFFTGNYVTDPLRLSESFTEAIQARDAETIASMVQADGTTVTAEKLGPFMTLLEDDAYETKLIENLQMIDPETGRTPEGDVWIENVGKKFLFFDAYNLHMKTFTVHPTVSYPETAVYVDDEEEPIVAGPTAPPEITGLLPGEHRFRTEYTGGLNTLTSEKSANLQTANEALVDDAMMLDLSNAGKFGSITSDQPEAMVKINGTDVGKVKDIGANYRFGPFQDPVQVQLSLTTPLGTINTDAQSVSADGQQTDFVFPNMVQLPESFDTATLFVNGESINLTGADFAPFHRKIGPLKPEDTLAAQMEIDGKTTLSNEIIVGELEGEPNFSFTKTINFVWADSAATVILDGENAGQTVYQLAGDDMAADILNSYQTIAIEKKYPWGTFTSDTVEIGGGGDVRFAIDSMNDTLIRQLQDAVVTYLEEDAYAISNLKTNNYSNIEDPLLTERQALIQGLIDTRERVVRVSDQAHFDMSSIQFDDEGDAFWARISAQYVYNYQEYMAGIFRPIRLEMTEAFESYQFAMRYDANLNRWVIYEQRPIDGIGENTESFDLAY